MFALTLSAVHAQEGTAGQVDGIPDPEVHVRTNEYEVSLEHLCPDAPSDEAAQCVSSFNLAQNVEQTVLHSVKDVVYTEKYGKMFKLTECSIKKSPSCSIQPPSILLFQRSQNLDLRRVQEH